MKFICTFQFLLLVLFSQTSFGQHSEYIEKNKALHLVSGWNLIGFTCDESMSTELALSPIVDKLYIVKNNDGDAYLPNNNYNGIDSLHYGFGYQIKTTEAIVDFQFCPIVVPLVEGCVDETAFNFSITANRDDGSCYPIVRGCMDVLAFNFNDYDHDGFPNYVSDSLGIDVNTDDGTCIEAVYGCMYEEADNYNSSANMNDACIFSGCMDSLACNYEDQINQDDGSCQYPDEEDLDCEGNPLPNCYYPADEAFVIFLNNNVPSVMIGDCLDVDKAEYYEGPLSLYGQTFSDLDGIQFLTNLSHLEIRSNDALTSLPELSGLTNLSSLYIRYNTALVCVASYPQNLYIQSYWPPVCPIVCPYQEFLEYDAISYSYSVDSCLTFIVRGCMDSSSDNYNAEANVDDESCFVAGCTIEGSSNFNPLATLNDDSCVKRGCMFDWADNYDEFATVDDSTCYREGCTSDWAENFDIQATVDDASCFLNGCTSDWADNFIENATIDNNSCVKQGCMFDWADNYDELVTQDDETCYKEGCMLEWADNYDEFATQNTSDDNECFAEGCLNLTAENYKDDATHDDGSCIIYGCTLQMFPNYNSEATVDDLSCDMTATEVYGCTDSLSCDYFEGANVNNGSCSEYPTAKLDCEGNEITSYEVGDFAHGGIVFYVDETGQHGLVAATEDLPGTYEWGCYEEFVNGAEGESIGTGYGNTMDIVNQGCTTDNGGVTAAQATLDAEINGYSDWHIPSR